MRIIVIGGDAAGMSAASRSRKVSPDSEVVVYEAGNHVSYSACGIPFFVGGEIAEFDQLLHYPLSKFREERRIEVNTNSLVTGINIDRKEVTVKSGDRTFTDRYDRLIIATGARPKVPELFAGHRLVLTLRSLDDMNALLERLDGVREVAIIGAGYVGLEMAEAFTSRGIHVTLIQRSERVLKGLDSSFADLVIEELKSNGVEVHLNSPVEDVWESDGDKITLRSGSLTASFDMVLLATGVVPNSEIAREAGIPVDENGAVIVDRSMRAGKEDVFAAGDVATTFDRITGDMIYFPLATGSNRSGRVAGISAAGGKTEYPGICRTEVVKVFSLNIGRTGLGMEDAARAGFDPVSATIKAYSRASYYPGAQDLRIMMTGDRKTRKLLGATIIGKEGVAKRIDVVAAALYSGLLVDDLTGIDYSYSPPFAPAWEPLGVAAEVLMKKL